VDSANRESLSSSGTFKTYANLGEEGNQVISNSQWVGRGMGGSWPGEGGPGHPWATYVWVLNFPYFYPTSISVICQGHPSFWHGSASLLYGIYF
jgi:hypothetical protein